MADLKQSDDDRCTVVLLHSSASSARQWDALAAMLETRFRVQTIDFHGHGQRPGWGGHSPLSLADDATLAGPLLNGSVHVVGHSYGGAVALKLAALHPKRVRSVVAYEPTLFRPLIEAARLSPAAREVVALADQIDARLSRGEPESAAQRFVDFWSGAGTWSAMPPGRQHAIASRMHSVLAHFDALFSEPLDRSQLARLGMPMLFLSGAGTVDVAQRVGELLRTTLPRAEHRQIAGAGHMGPITHAADVNRCIVDFLLRQERGVQAAPQREPELLTDFA